MNAQFFEEQLKELKFPQKEVVVFFYKTGEMLEKFFLPSENEAYQSCQENNTDAVKEEVFDKEAHAEKMEKYSKAKEKIMEAFKNALFEEHGVENNPKRELLYSKAWENGHAYGLSNVAIEFDNLVELIQ